MERRGIPPFISCLGWWYQINWFLAAPPLPTEAAVVTVAEGVVVVVAVTAPCVAASGSLWWWCSIYGARPGAPWFAICSRPRTPSDPCSLGAVGSLCWSSRSSSPCSVPPRSGFVPVFVPEHANTNTNTNKNKKQKHAILRNRSRTEIQTTYTTQCHAVQPVPPGFLLLLAEPADITETNGETIRNCDYGAAIKDISLWIGAALKGEE